MSKLYIFAVMVVVLVAVTAIQSADQDEERRRVRGCGRNPLQDGCPCPRSFRDQNVTVGDRTCFCQSGRGGGRSRPKYTNCRDVAGSTVAPTTTTAPIETTAAPIETTTGPVEPTVGP